MQNSNRLARLEQQAQAAGEDGMIEIRHIRWLSDNQIEVSIEKRERRPDDVDGGIYVDWTVSGETE